MSRNRRFKKSSTEIAPHLADCNHSKNESLYFEDLTDNEFKTMCIVWGLKIFLSFLLWISIFCVISLLLTMIWLKDSNVFAEIFYYSSFPWGLYVFYGLSMLLIATLKHSYIEVGELWNSQIKQLYFAVPILASLLFLTIDRVLP